MSGLDLFMNLMFGTVGILMVFLFIAKKRMDRNEPVFGWARKQHLQETGQDGNQTGSKVKANKSKNDGESVKDLIGIEEIKYGIFYKKNNEYCIVLSTQSVNYDLLSVSARQTIILGYGALFRSVRFPLQCLGQSVAQDMRKEQERFNSNLKKCNAATKLYNESVIDTIKRRSENEFRISRKIYYAISFIPQPSKMGQLSPEQREESIVRELHQRARIVAASLRQANITTEVLDSFFGMEVMKRALNRDRMVANTIDDVIHHEKVSSLFVTADADSLPGLDELVNDPEEVRRYVQNIQKEEAERLSAAGNY
ncbi:hypothetical protein [Paenibacillus sp. FSL P4-0288]|uniref:hypothetical protein n=1 Tax=Paenibacillus sp. FSL P4-0288 TaxID=2921633 RepID=UPI0030F5A418